MLRRSIPRVCGLYAKGFIDNVETVFTIDSGASATLVSSRIFHKLRKNMFTLTANNSSRFEGPAEGQEITVQGRVKLPIKLGTLHLEVDVVVADIRDDVLLGADVILGLPEGPFNFILTENKLEWNGHSVEVVQVTKAKQGKVLCSKDVTLKGHSEEIIDVEISSIGSVVGEIMIEPSENLQRNHKLALACSLNTSGPK